MKNAWTYYVNQLNEADRFIKELTDELSKRDEDTIVVMFGDHLPTMGLQDSDMKSGDIYKTKYITWNNMGLPKEDADLYAYQLLAQTTDTVGIHEGTIMNYHQTQMNSTDEASYQDGLDLLQYDILYGKCVTATTVQIYIRLQILSWELARWTSQMCLIHRPVIQYIFTVTTLPTGVRFISTTPRWLRLISQQVCLLSRRKTSVMVMR